MSTPIANYCTSVTNTRNHCKENMERAPDKDKNLFFLSLFVFNTTKQQACSLQITIQTDDFMYF